MKTLSLNSYGPIISDKSVGEKIFWSIYHILETNEPVTVDLGAIKSMATFNAKQIFGQLYVKLGASSFFQKVKLQNVTDDLKIIIQIGIQNALEDSESAPAN